MCALMLSFHLKIVCMRNTCLENLIKLQVLYPVTFKPLKFTMTLTTLIYEF